jgi:hypothetical protein
LKRAFLTHIYEEEQDQTIGVLQFKDEADAVFTMEPGISDESPRLKDGTYLAKRCLSPRFGWTWTLIGEDVSAEPEPGVLRNQVRIHPGNDDEESDACVLPGLSVTWDPRDQEPQVSQSRDAFRKIERWAEGEDFMLIVRSGKLVDVA